MFPFDLEPMLSGISLGITFGLVFGISREEKVKWVASRVFGTIIVAFLAIHFYAYGYSLDVPLEFLIWSCIGFILAFLVALGYRKRGDKPVFVKYLWDDPHGKFATRGFFHYVLLSQFLILRKSYSRNREGS